MLKPPFALPPLPLSSTPWAERARQFPPDRARESKRPPGEEVRPEGFSVIRVSGQTLLSVFRHLVCGGANNKWLGEKWRDVT